VACQVITMRKNNTNSQIAIRQMGRNFERISQLLRESGQENRAFEYALIANRIDKKLSSRADEEWKSIVLNDGPDGKEIARLVFLELTTPRLKATKKTDQAREIFRDYPIETEVLWGSEHAVKSIVGLLKAKNHRSNHNDFIQNALKSVNEDKI
jgi:hypothetical protein